MVEFQADPMSKREAEMMFNLGWIFGIIFGLAGGIALGHYFWA